MTVSDAYGDGVTGWAVFDGTSNLKHGYGTGIVSVPVGKTYKVFGVAGSGGRGANSVSISPKAASSAKTATALSLSAPTVVNYAGAAKLSGRLAERTSGKALSGRRVVVQVSKDGSAWTDLKAVTTDATGGYSASSGLLTVKRYFRARYAGSTTLSAATSGVRAVRPRVYFASAPQSSAYTQLLGTAYRVWGDFKPKHATGSAEIKLKAYRWEKRTNGTYAYVLKRTITTATSNPAGSAYSKYKVSVKLPYRGKWRIRAYHAADAKNATTYSAYRYITVK